MRPSPPGSEQRARVQPYLFAYRALPHLFFKNPPEIMNILGRSDAHEFLEGAWSLIGEECTANDRAAFLNVTLLYESLGDDIFVVLIRLPRPRRTGEAYYAILTTRFTTTGPAQPSFARYFTVGRIDDATGETHPVLIEWDADNVHQDHGDLDDTAPPTILAALARVLPTS